MQLNPWGQLVPMEMFVLWMATTSMRVGWKCASTTSGERSVTTHGPHMMPLLSVNNWDMPILQVCLCYCLSFNYDISGYDLTCSQMERHTAMLTLVKEPVQFSWTVCNVVLQTLNFCSARAIQFSRFPPHAVTMTMLE